MEKAKGEGKKSTVIDSLVSLVSVMHAESKASQRGEVFANSYVSWKTKSTVPVPEK